MAHIGAIKVLFLSALVVVVYRFGLVVVYRLGLELCLVRVVVPVLAFTYEISLRLIGLFFLPFPFLPLMESICYSIFRIIDLKFLSIGVTIFYFRSQVIGSLISFLASLRGDLLLPLISV
jgi:hypothetical protein